MPFANCFSFLIAFSAFGELKNFATLAPVFLLRKVLFILVIIL